MAVVLAAAHGELAARPIVASCTCSGMFHAPVPLDRAGILTGLTLSTLAVPVFEDRRLVLCTRQRQITNLLDQLVYLLLILDREHLGMLPHRGRHRAVFLERISNGDQHLVCRVYGRSRNAA